jgi:leucyl aminopeptidase
MEFSARVVTAATERAACVVVGVFEGRRLPGPGGALNQASGGYLAAGMADSGFEGRAGQVLPLFKVPGVTATWVLLIGLGAEKDWGRKALRKAAARSIKAIEETGAKDALSLLAALDGPGLDPVWRARCVVEASADAHYRYDATKSKKDKPRHLRTLTLGLSDKAELKAATTGLEQGQAIATGVAFAKELGNLPGNHCTPSDLADAARGLGRRHKSLKVTVLGEPEMKKLGMGALLSVSKGSRQPPRLIVIEYKGGKRGAKPHCLIGKGLTFDAGGISIKPAAAMDEMKYDMCGGASVLGAMQTLALLKLPVNVVGIVPASENLPDGAANKPGDIVTSMSGQTIEILNTDAEGRLILCDAITYARKFEPATVVDIATLTGACVIALGAHAHGLLGNDQGVVSKLLAAGEAADDRAWQLPLWEEYQDQLKSPFADMANVGGREAGTITAACFLARYTRDLKWAHLDVAGTAWKSGADKGSTGRPVPLLVQYLIDHSA